MTAEHMSTDPSPRLPAAPQRPRRFWTMREQKIVRDQFPAGGAAAVKALLPHRSEHSIYQQARSLGLRSPRGEYSMERWTTNEHIDAIIERAYAEPKKGGIAKCAQVVGRPRHWVSNRARQLGLVFPRFKEPEWSQAELDYVEANAHKSLAVLQRGLAKLGFKRTETAIKVKVKRAGIDRTDPNHYTASGLARLFNVDIKVVTGWIAKGWLIAGRRGTDRTEQQGGDQWWVKRKSVRRFVVQNVAAVDFRKVDKFWLVDLLAGSYEAKD